MWITEYSIKNHIDQDWVLAICTLESHFDTNASDGKGSWGIAQLQISTAEMVYHEVHPEQGRTVFESQYLCEVPEENIFLACRHIRDLIDSYAGDYIKATRSYNVGSRNAQKGRLHGLTYCDNVFHQYMEYEKFKEK